MIAAEHTADCRSTEAALAVPPRPDGARIAGFDFAKGGLVVLMVAYHSLNYFRYDKDILKYLHFLPGSFIFITGFLITQVYRERLERGEPGVYRRLIVRGLKLLAIFIGLNLLAHAAFSSNYNRRPLGLEFFSDHLADIFLTGGQRAAVFEVLLPISYLLLAAPALLVAAIRFPVSYTVVTAAAIAACIAASLHASVMFNVDLLSVGALGLLAGLVPLARINTAASGFAPLLGLFAAYQVGVAFAYPSYGINLLGVALTVLVLYALASRLAALPVLASELVRLGRYSLVGYIVQIAILQVIFRIFRRLEVSDGALAMAFGITLALTVLVVRSLEATRRQFAPVNTVYRQIFG